jgi:hypothetical protein
MWLLSASIIIFFVVIAFIIYANWPSTPTGSNSQCGCGGRGCANCPCNRCNKPKNRCGCPQSGGGCSFC